MFNFDNASIPRFFPVLEGAQLRPWFTLPTLDNGLGLIRDQRVTDYHCVRGSVGALMDSGAVIALQFEKSTKLSQGFLLRNRRCDICSLRPEDNYCEHLAAVAILGMTVTATPASKVTPTAFAVTDSNWWKLGSFLNKWLGRTETKLTCREDGDGYVWDFSPDEGGVQVTLPQSFQKRGMLFFPKELDASAMQDKAEDVARLDSQLRDWAMTTGEKALEKTGNRSIGWQKDTSFWFWLARTLFMIHGDSLPELFRNSTDSRFFLETQSARGPGALKIILPKKKIWELIREIPVPSADSRILPAALECYSVSYNPDNSLEIIPSLRLSDGRVLSREVMGTNRFGDVYHLQGEGFLPTTRLPAEGVINNPSRKKSTLPLLAFVQDEKDRDIPFTIPVNDIPTFYEVNRQALHYPENMVAPELLDMEVLDLPERLVIDSFEQQGDWCYLSLSYGLGNLSITLEDIKSARGKKQTCIPGRKWLKLDGTPLSWLHNLVDERFDPEGSGRIRLSYRETVALTTLIPELDIAIEKESPRKRFSRLIDVGSWTDGASLSDVPSHLRTYQRNGLAWLNQLYTLGIGGLLADDMGLGKTHQGLALLLAAVRHGDKKRMLVICPASVVLHWADKIDRFYKEIDYTVYHGPQRDLEKAENRSLILTSFGVIRQDFEQLRNHAFDIILVDEIQNLKNHRTATHQAVLALNGRVKIGLTGTPVENSLQDLRSLFDICLPGFLGSEREFEHLYVKPITEKNETRTRDRLRSLISPFILRRSRHQVLTELPEIIEDDRICELDEDQVGLYRQVIEEREGDLERLADETGNVPYMNILAIITRLKQICCHPCLVQGCSDPASYGSGKWDLFVELIAELMAAEMKCVVFSQYTGMLELMEDYLQKAGIGFCSLKGSMTVSKRQKMIDRFNNDPDCRVFCASLLAGGVGIDLTSGQAVIHYDRWWNPAREEQATARVHRMGQDKVVQVFRLITRGTLEEKIHNLIMKKRRLATSFVQEDEAGIIKQMDRKQLMDLFR
jgi:superfamily II DNA or RNA helicase